LQYIPFRYSSMFDSKGVSLKSCYTLLGIDETATKDDIKRSFREASHIHHPDKASGESTAYFIRLKQAYEILLDHHSKQEVIEHQRQMAEIKRQARQEYRPSPQLDKKKAKFFRQMELDRIERERKFYENLKRKEKESDDFDDYYLSEDEYEIRHQKPKPVEKTPE